MSETDRHRDPERHKEQVRRGNRARYKARIRLQRMHPVDWERLLTEENAAEGLETIGPNRRTDPDRAALADAVAAAREARRRRRDLTGREFGRWTVIEKGPNSDPTPSQPTGGTRWLCRCACGTEKLVTSDSLRSGDSKSCGCWARELTAARNRARRTA
jgi:hypothetical protein